MGLHAVKILGINVTISSKKEILEYVKKSLEFREKSLEKSLTIVTPNPEQIVLAQKNFSYAKILNQADVALPDGGGVVWAASKLGLKNLTRTIPGVEFMGDLVAMAAKQGFPIALIGGRGDIAVEAFECLSGAHPGLTGIGVSVPPVEVHGGTLQIEGYDDPESYFSKLARTIVQNGVKMVFVGLGAPKQELFIERLSRAMSLTTDKRILFMSVGGSFDIIANRTPRAPAWVRRLRVPLFSGLIGSEFIWRLFHEPWRAGRQLALVKFVWLVVRERMRKN